MVEEPANYCLDASANDKTNSANLKKSSFSPCMEGTKQVLFRDFHQLILNNELYGVYEL